MARLWPMCALLVATSSAVLARSRDEYCRINLYHTMCLYPGISAACGTEYYRGLTAQEVKFILSEHNRVRNEVASGNEPHGDPGPQPPASSMRLLEWDEELATIAQRWADQCMEGHDEHRETPNFDAVGQNVLLRISCRMPPTWSIAIAEWRAGVGWWNRSDVQNYRFVARTDAYTQLVWAKTRTVGCGYMKHYADSRCNQVFVCNYGPGGNRHSYPVYEVGEPHSRCPTSSVDPRYPALCPPSL